MNNKIKLIKPKKQKQKCKMPICVERQFPLLCQWSMCVWERICLCEIEGESVLESGRNRKSKKKRERARERKRERER